VSVTDLAQVVVFLGPSLAVDEARRVLAARYLPPARCGDVLRARRLKPRVIAVVDGLFETTAAVWHKEILLALEDGIGVLGAASMGALRAAELAAFGMVGVGAIFEAYRDGRYTDDDEVAVAHGPASEGFRPRSDALVNVRATVARAVETGVISAHSAAELLRLAKQTFYPERRLTDAIDQLWGKGARAGEAGDLRRFLEQGGYVDQKRLDALALLRGLAEDARHPPTSSPPAISTHRSSFIMKLHHDVMCRPFLTSEPDLPAEEQVALEARLLGPRYRLLRRLARLMSMAAALTRAQHVVVTPKHVAQVFEDGELGLGSAARSARWRQAHDLDAAAMRRFVSRLARVHALLDTQPRTRELRAGELRYLLALLRIDDRYVRWGPVTVRTGAVADGAVVRRAQREAPEELRLYRWTARLWRAIDEAVVAVGIDSPDEVQTLADDFRRARGLIAGRTGRAWMRANGLGTDGLADLVTLDARLTLIDEASRTYTLGLGDDIEPVCWLHDAIRLAGLYPSLRRQVATATDGHGSGRRASAQDLERALRQHWSRLGESAPADVDGYARSLDFGDGELLATALTERLRSEATRTGGDPLSRARPSRRRSSTRSPSPAGRRGAPA
jgi:hypothetical protein